MKITINRDSVCMGDDFGHQLTIECSEGETIESLMIKILQTDFFPAEDLSKVTKKWTVKIDKQNILTFFPNENKVDYHINKNTMINNLKSQNIYFKEIASNRIDFLELLTFPFLFLFIILRSIYAEIINTIFKLKQQKWTHIVAPFYLLYTLTLAFAIVAYLITDDFSYPYLVILVGACLYPVLLSITIIVFILLKILSFKFKNINQISNKFFLHNVFYNILWFLSILTLIIGSIVFTYNILKIYI